MVSLKKFLLALALNNIHSFNLRRYSDKIKYGDILERQSNSVRNHQILVNSLIHIIQFELRFSVAPNILGETGYSDFSRLMCAHNSRSKMPFLTCQKIHEILYMLYMCNENVNSRVALSHLTI